jgi:hypothetical protein
VRDLNEWEQTDLQGIRVTEKGGGGPGYPCPEQIDVPLDLRDRTHRKARFPQGRVNAAETTSIPLATACQTHEHTAPFAWGTNDQGFRLFRISYHFQLSKCPTMKRAILPAIFFHSPVDVSMFMFLEREGGRAGAECSLVGNQWPDR